MVGFQEIWKEHKLKSEIVVLASDILLASPIFVLSALLQRIDIIHV